MFQTFKAALITNNNDYCLETLVLPYEKWYLILGQESIEETKCSATKIKPSQFTQHIYRNCETLFNGLCYSESLLMFQLNEYKSTPFFLKRVNGHLSLVGVSGQMLYYDTNNNKSKYVDNSGQLNCDVDGHFLPESTFTCSGIPLETKIKLCNMKVCNNKEKWIPKEQWCNGKRDCPDQSDESSCGILCDRSEIATIKLPPLGESNLSVSILVNSIPGINALDQTFFAEYTLRIVWTDDRLGFCNIRGIDNTLYPSEIEQIWTPLISIQKTDSIERVVFNEDTGLMFKPDPIPDKNGTGECFESSRKGKLIYNRDYKTYFICEFELSMFPFDTQICRMTLRVETKRGRSIKLLKGRFNYTGPIELSRHFIKNQFFVVHSRMYAGSERVRDSHITVEFVLQRSLDNILMTTFLPTLLLNIIGHAMRYLDKEYFETSLVVNLTVMLVLATM